ncbi:unnamed protein product [Cuscuta campestris]|uniref:Uncharacterized protein n=1 Tax=Cuscuta campestris TaxID=132261 RepID=A0A484KJD2_9ASTE|nr:unnamed protein product [Cuscuta campestris]
MTVGCPTGADVKTPVFGPSEGMTGMAEAMFGPSGVTIAAVAAVGPITEVTGADPIVALDPTKVVIGVDPMAALVLYPKYLKSRKKIMDSSCTRST